MIEEHVEYCLVKIFKQQIHILDTDFQSESIINTVYISDKKTYVCQAQAKFPACGLECM